MSRVCVCVSSIRQDSLDEVKNIVKISTEDGYRIAMKMLVKWINENRDPKRTRTFFAGMSATHQAYVNPNYLI